jgi:hypothetical protein
MIIPIEKITFSKKRDYIAHSYLDRKAEVLLKPLGLWR